MEFVPLGYLFETILAVRASSAAVERVFFYQWDDHSPTSSCENVESLCLPSVPSLLTVVLVNVRAVAWLIL